MLYNDSHPEVLTVLREAERFLTNPDHWSKGSLFINEQGYVLTMQGMRKDPTKVARCCALGALYLADPRGVTVEQARQELEKDLPRWANPRWATMSLVSYNDNRTHRSVLRLLRRTIARLEAEQVTA